MSGKMGEGVFRVKKIRERQLKNINDRGERRCDIVHCRHLSIGKRGGYMRRKESLVVNEITQAGPGVEKEVQRGIRKEPQMPLPGWRGGGIALLDEQD